MKIKGFEPIATAIAVMAFIAAPAFSVDKPAAQGAVESAEQVSVRMTNQKTKHVDTRTLSGGFVTKPGNALSIDASQARITVTAWSGNEVVVEGKVEVGSDDADVVREFINATRLLAEPTEGGGRIRLRSPFDEDTNFRQRRITVSYSARLDIKVPESQSLTIKNAFGDVTVSGVSGRHDIRNESGEVKVESCGGGLRLETSFARASVTDFKGDVDVRNESGEVNLKNVAGRADVRNSFSPVTFERIGGDLTVKSESSAIAGTGVSGLCRIESSFAGIEVADVGKNLEIKGASATVTVDDAKSDVAVESSFAPIKVTNVGGAVRVTAESAAVTVEDVVRTATVRSSFAAIEVRRAGGDVKVNGESSPVLVEDPGGAVDVSNSFGYVILKGTRGSVLVRGESSSVELSAVKSVPPGSVVDIKTSFGPITVTLPAGVEPKVWVRTEFGDVRSDYPVYVMERAEGAVRVVSRDERVAPPGQVRFAAEKDAVVIRLETTSADIVIKK